jgi:S1-C subfamily serine protease
MVLRGGLSLAIPAAAAQFFAVHGAPPRLGVTLREVKLERARTGLLILEIEPGGAAERASLMIGDILIGIRDRRVESVVELKEALGAPGPARLRFLRGDRSSTREVVVALRRSAPAGFAA